MYKNLDGETFGITGRQNEVIELALSYNFEGINVDLSEMLSRAKASGQDFATRYIDSAEIRNGDEKQPIRIGEFKLPIKLSAEQEKFEASLDKLKECCDIAKAIGATICRCEVEPANDELNFQDNFEQYRRRLTEVAGILDEYGIRLGIGFNAIPKKREGKQNEFIHQAESCLALINSITASNVGLALDLWHWTLGGGTLEQVKELKPGQLISVRIADIAADVDAAKVSSEQRLLPGSVEGSLCADLVKLLDSLGYEGPVTSGHSPVAFGRMPREAMVQRVRDALDRILVEAGVIEPPKIPTPVFVPDDPTVSEDEDIEGLEETDEEVEDVIS